jgi:hypothetical protein
VSDVRGETSLELSQFVRLNGHLDFHFSKVEEEYFPRNGSKHEKRSSQQNEEGNKG